MLFLWFLWATLSLLPLHNPQQQEPGRALPAVQALGQREQEPAGPAGLGASTSERERCFRRLTDANPQNAQWEGARARLRDAGACPRAFQRRGGEGRACTLSEGSDQNQNKTRPKGMLPSLMVLHLCARLLQLKLYN